MTCDVILLYVAPGNNPPVITSHPNDTTVSLHYGNESTTFSCVADGGSSDIQYSWFNKTDDDDDMILERRTTNTLMLTPVTVEMNNTQYYCVATNNSGNATSESARLTVTSKLIMNTKVMCDS